MQHARVLDGVVMEIIPDIDGFPIESRFSEEIVTTLVACGGDVEPGWAYDGEAFAAPVVAAPDKAALKAYANAEQWRRATGGYIATIGGEDILVPTDPTSMGLMTGKAARLDQPNPPASFKWQMPSGFVTITAEEFRPLAIAVADFVQATFDELAVVLAAIDADTVTSFAAIDAAAWPA